MFNGWSLNLATIILELIWLDPVNADIPLLFSRKPTPTVALLSLPDRIMSLFFRLPLPFHRSSASPTILKLYDLISLYSSWILTSPLSDRKFHMPIFNFSFATLILAFDIPVAHFSIQPRFCRPCLTDCQRSQYVGLFPNIS